jgi:hypothetical protein
MTGWTLETIHSIRQILANEDISEGGRKVIDVMLKGIELRFDGILGRFQRRVDAGD